MLQHHTNYNSSCTALFAQCHLSIDALVLVRAGVVAVVIVTAAPVVS